MERGKIITLEGLDCSFKETNAKNLKFFLDNTLRTPVNLVSFPRYQDKAAIFVERYLDGTYKDMSLQQVILTYAMDRFDYIKTANVIERLDKGEWFIFDRYVNSNLIYQYANIEKNEVDELRDLIYRIEYNILELPKPDIVLALMTDFELIEEKLKEKHKTTPSDKHESDLEYLRKVYNRYNILITRYGWDMIDVIRDSDTHEPKDQQAILFEIVETLKKREII